jgi:hypothetical protein
MKKDIYRDRSTWVYKVVEIYGPKPRRSKVKVGTMLLLDRPEGKTTVRDIFDFKKGKPLYGWVMERVCKVQVKDGKAQWPGGKCPC